MMAKIVEKVVADSGSKPPPPVSKAELADQAGIKKRGRKPKEPEITPVPQVTPETVKITVGVPFDVIARVRRFDGWKLTDAEAEKLTVAWLPVFNLWLAPHMGQYTILAAALLATIGTVTGKAADERDHREKESDLIKKGQDILRDAPESDNSHIRPQGAGQNIPA